jgi:PTS system fructose-specific IIB component
MKIVAISACTMGVAHTFIAKDKLIEAAEKLGHQIKVETQGSIGAENIITEEDVKDADIVLIAADINIKGEERFKGKPIVRVSVSVAIRQPEQLLGKIEEKLKLMK